MACLLEEETIPYHSQLLRWSLLFSSTLVKMVPSLQGVYCCLLSTLITNLKWELLMEDGNPVQLSRNRTHFIILETTLVSSRYLILSLPSRILQIEITFPSDISQAKALNVCEKVCPSIHETVLTGIRKASRQLNYNNSIPEVASISLL